MTEASTPQPSPPSEQLPWGISYLREDIQDLRQDLRESIQEVRQEIQEVRQEVRHDLQEVRQEMRSLRDHLDSRFTWAIATMVAMAGVIVAVIKL